MRTRRHRSIARSGHCRGAATVEMAVVLPLVMLMVLAAVDFGRIVHSYVVVSHAARCGASYGSMHQFSPYTRPFWEQQVRQAISDEMACLSGFNAQQLQSTIETSTNADGLFDVSVEVHYPFATIVSWVGLPSPTSLTRRIEMRQTR